MTEIQEKLFALRDEKYRDFNASLIPTVDKAAVIGVRVPQLRRLAKELKNGPWRRSSWRTCPMNTTTRTYSRPC